MHAWLWQLTDLLLAMAWIVPDPEPGRGHRERKRMRGKGIMAILPESRSGAKATYFLELQRYWLELPLTLFGENLQYAQGVEPPTEENMVYDVATFTHRPPHAQPPLTLARAHEAFALPEYGGW